MSSVVQDQPSASPISPRGEDEVDLLLRFVHERDVLCPRCGYNLRNLTQPVCPECREPLALKVGVPRIMLAPLLLTLAPGVFCAVAFGLFLVVCAMEGQPPADPELWFTVSFLALSGAATTTLAINNRWFLRLDAGRQWMAAAAAWVVHIAAFLVFVANI
jgi:hypothetical protein